MANDFEVKLQYKRYEWEDGDHFIHEWRMPVEIEWGNMMEKLQEIVGWCYEHWDDDPCREVGWYYSVKADVSFDYKRKPNPRLELSRLREIHFWIGVNDDAWAAMFKLREGVNNFV